MDLIGGDALRELGVAECAHVDKRVKRLEQTGPQRTVIIRSVGIRAYLESRAVVRFERAGQEVRGCMVAKVARQVTDANTIARG